MIYFILIIKLCTALIFASQDNGSVKLCKLKNYKTHYKVTGNIGLEWEINLNPTGKEKVQIETGSPLKMYYNFPSCKSHK